MTTKKLFLLCLITFSCLYSNAQLNPITNLQYNSVYNYPAYSNCPQFSCFHLTWSQPAISTSDTLKGYNIYQNDILYHFTTDTSFGCPFINQCDAGSSTWFINVPFWIIVKAVYDKDSLKSVANDSIHIVSFPIDITKLNEKKYITISPNPFSTQTTFRSDNFLKDANLTVYNSFGQQVKQVKNIIGQTIILQRDNLPSGLYFFRLTQDNKIIMTDRLVITDN